MLESSQPALAAPAEPPNATAPDFAARIAFERVRTLFELTPPPVLAGASFALLLGVMMAPVAPRAAVVGWTVLKLALALARLLHVGLFNRSKDRRENLQAWWVGYLALMLADAVSWGAMVPLFLPHAHGIATTVLLAGAVAVASVGVFTNYSHWAASLLYQVSVLLPVAASQLAIGERDNLLTALAVFMYLGVLALEAWRSEKRLVETLRLRYQNAWIAEQRRQALVLAEHSSAAKSRFLAAVSHEMRTPLNGILGTAQLMSTRTGDPEQRRQLEVVRRSALHLQTVIADLLDLSRVEFGRLQLQQEPFAVAETVHEVTDLLSAVAAEKGLGFEVRLDRSLPRHALGDAARIKQVLHNLIGNALKFTSSGAVLVEVSPTADGLSFTVGDTGRGIPREEAERIFDAFTQAGDSPAQRAGTGLGLTISRQLARAMGGDVSYEPGAAGGSVFRFTLAAPSAEAPSHAEPWSASELRLHGRVLVVDDSPVNAMVASGMLQHFGIEAEMVDDGLKALHRMGESRYDAVLMDCQMPGLDGFEATRRWRSGEAAGQRLPIIAVTANAVPGDRERCLSAGMDDYLAKPFDLNDLGRMLQRHLPR